MNNIKNILRSFYKKNTIIFKWVFALIIIVALVVVPLLSALLSL